MDAASFRDLLADYWHEAGRLRAHNERLRQESEVAKDALDAALRRRRQAATRYLSDMQRRERDVR